MATPTTTHYSCASGGRIDMGRYSADFGVMNETISALGPGEAVEIGCAYLNTLDSTSVYPTEGKVSYTISNWTTKMAWDVAAQRAIIYAETAGALSAGGAWSVLLWWNASTNSWGHVRNPFGRFCGHGYDSNTIDQVERVLYKAPYNSADIERWDCANMAPLSPIARPSTSLGPVTGGFGGVEGLAWHPNLGTLGSLIWCDSSLGRIYRWDRQAQTWTQVAANKTIRLQTVAHYNPVADAVICGGANAGDPLYIVSNTGSITETQPSPVPVLSHADGQMFHPCNKRAVSMVFSPDGNCYEVSLSTGAWSNAGAFPSVLSPTHPIIGCPIREGNVYLFWRWGSGGTSKAILYRHII